uniref:Uncharacterized protein n=1 Tax=Glossina morsitans morsitans TaxID=37546 RepID=A0A1B0G9M3_GLOMM
MFYHSYKRQQQRKQQQQQQQQQYHQQQHLQLSTINRKVGDIERQMKTIKTIMRNVKKQISLYV